MKAESGERCINGRIEEMPVSDAAKALEIKIDDGCQSSK